MGVIQVPCVFSANRLVVLACRSVGMGNFPGAWECACVCVCEHAHCSPAAWKEPEAGMFVISGSISEPVQVGLNLTVVLVGKSLPMCLSFFFCKVGIISAPPP